MTPVTPPHDATHEAAARPGDKMLDVKEASVEPGLLRVFRIATGLRLAILVLLALAARSGPPSVQRASFWHLAEAILLFVFLLLPGLPRRLGRAYLPLALLMAAVLPILFRQIGLPMLNAPGPPVPNAPGPPRGPNPIALWAPELWMALLPPTVLTAWRYDLRGVVVLVLGTTLLDTGLLFARTNLQYTGFVLALPMFRAGALLLVGYAVVFLAGVQRERREVLMRANVQLAHHAAVVERLATTSERNRLARELHDTLAHTLSGLAVQLEAVRALWDTDPTGARALFEQALGTTRSGLKEARRALADLRASPLEDQGLPLALRGLAESVAARTGAALTLRTPDSGVRFPPEIEQSAYRVAQEALENVARHADARHITVVLETARATLRLTVSDDGQGFDTAALAADGFGVTGMRERAEMLGGSVEIETRPGGPTTLRLQLPVPS